MSLIILTLAAAPPDAAAFRAAVVSADSATAILQQQCPDDRIRAVRKPMARKAPPRSIRMALTLKDRETLRYRRVRLMCGDTLFSDADNWYVPTRLTPDMNATLEGSDTPFGRVIAPLKATRQTLGVRAGQGPRLFTVSAVLTSAAGTPLSGVVERYQRAVLHHSPSHSPK